MIGPVLCKRFAISCAFARTVTTSLGRWEFPQQSPLLEQVEQFKDNHDNDNYSDYIEDSVHVGANTRVGGWWPAFILAHIMP
jgi:hypothetical protein